MATRTLEETFKELETRIEKHKYFYDDLDRDVCYYLKEYYYKKNGLEKELLETSKNVKMTRIIGMTKILSELLEEKSCEDAEPKQKWIPVSECLPEDENEVIVTVCDKSGCTPDYYSAIGIYSTHLNCWIVDMISENVIAWMPLPEPWRGE